MRVTHAESSAIIDHFSPSGDPSQSQGIQRGPHTGTKTPATSTLVISTIFFTPEPKGEPHTPDPLHLHLPVGCLDPAGLISSCPFPVCLSHDKPHIVWPLGLMRLGTPLSSCLPPTSSSAPEGFHSTPWSSQTLTSKLSKVLLQDVPLPSQL